jgi:short-subunit dehydrogenase
MEQNMKIKVAVITGVSSGIGNEILKLLVENHFKVFASCLTEEEAQSLKKDFPGNVHFSVLDLRNENQISRFCDLVKEHLNSDEKISLLINNAGVASINPILHETEENYINFFKINSIAPFLMVKNLFPSLEKGPNTKILNIGSVSGQFGWPFLGGYGGSKHALHGMTETLRRELRPFGIQVALIIPGYVKTPIWTKLNREYSGDHYQESVQLFREKVVKEGEKGLCPSIVARKILTIVNSKKLKKQYVMVPNYLLHWVLPSLLPDKTIDKVMAKNFNL